MDENLSWDHHTTKLIGKLNGTNYIMAKIKNEFPFGVRKTIYTLLAQSHLVWGSIVTGATCICRNKTHSVGLYVYSSNIETKLIMRVDYHLYIVRRWLFIQHALCTPNSRKKIAYFYILEASPRHYFNC